MLKKRLSCVLLTGSQIQCILHMGYKWHIKSYPLIGDLPFVSFTVVSYSSKWGWWVCRQNLCEKRGIFQEEEATTGCHWPQPILSTNKTRRREKMQLSLKNSFPKISESSLLGIFRGSVHVLGLWNSSSLILMLTVLCFILMSLLKL